MSVKLTVPKRMLTHYVNKLDTIISRFKNEGLEDLTIAEGEAENFQAIRDYVQQFEQAIGAIEAAIAKIEHVMQDYASSYSTLSQPESKEQQDFEEYSTKAETCLSEAFDYLLILQARVRAFKAWGTMTNATAQVTREQQSAPTNAVQSKRVELPTLPIPSFHGDIWEWDNFWELFNANIHSQDLPELYKFNYLLNALKGEARESVRKFQITAENYQKAVDFLLRKYGNADELIQRLIERLERCTSRSSSLRDQRTLLEQLQAIVAQLEHKGESIDSQWLQKQVLSKFPAYIQRNVLMKKQASKEKEALQMHGLLNLIEEVITCEEVVSLYTSKETQQPQPSVPRKEKARKELQQTYVRSCMFCGENHKSIACTKYSTPKTRSQYLREHKLCLICASPQHATSQCQKRKCFNCQGLHHTSCCFKSAQEAAPSTSMRTAPASRQEKSKGSASRQTVAQTKSMKKVHHLARENDEVANDAVVCELHSERKRQTYLLTGEVTVLNENDNTLRKVCVVFDTGAEASFISRELAEELRLTKIGEEKLRLHTFGTDSIQEKAADIVRLNAWDVKGAPVTLDLLTYDIVVKPFEAPLLSDEDADFLRQKNISFDMTSPKTCHPKILLGCDSMWTFVVNENNSHLRLPSGLHLIESSFGYLVSGQSNIPEDSTDTEDEDKWDGYWTLDTEVNTVSIATKDTSEAEKEREREAWEEFWSLDAAGTEKFGHSQNDEQARIDDIVLEDFLKTVERREDGYYVRLPWKKDVSTLPDNKYIAYRRLANLWKSLQKSPNTLQQYDDVFQDQLRRNILEHVPEEATEQKRVHYLPHQAVITPHKKTTKLRVVYDASAHYKGSCSLNDVLHRGPVMLPQLFGVLLRFRIGHIAVISDVEKAFLQVRLHEEDRDAARCLWLRDCASPPTRDNILVLRFTRIPFGLISSPFLLAATTHYHLDQYKDDLKLVQEMKENLYVDNLMITADTVEEASICYQKIKNMFKELSMNIREFVCNNQRLANEISEIDRSSDVSTKILGIQWNSFTDRLLLSCTLNVPRVLTKRAVTSAIASVYDPMGWMLPLLHKPKVFLQLLWKDKVDWDTPLSSDRGEEWYRICQKINNFTKELSRFVAKKHSSVTLIAFADASKEAIAACIYLKFGNSIHLLMAKAKLPSLKYESTVPKMELNAATLAMRLLNSVVTQLRSTVVIHDVYVFTDSEIVYYWVKGKPRKEDGVMVYNRLREINDISDHLISQDVQVYYGHVPTDQNPADCGTRGLDKNQLENHFWWRGPPFLLDSPKEWTEDRRLFQKAKKQEFLFPQSPDPLFAQLVAKLPKEEPSDIFERLKGHPYVTIKRIVARVLRFAKILLDRIPRRNINIERPTFFDDYVVGRHKELNAAEVSSAGKIIIQVHQKALCTPEVTASMPHLNIGPDDEGLLRCYGRMGRSCLDDSAKNPYLILQNSWLSEAIIRDCHSKGHPGIGHTIALVRQKFWIPKLRAQVTKFIRRCVECQRFNNLPYKYPNQGDLPYVRVQQARPFEHVGLDYFGPLSVKTNEDTTDKCFGAIITCMVTRLIHLDVVSDNSTIAFLNMLRRFFGRRGVPKSITSDNAPTFLLGEEILADCIKNVEQDVTLAKEMSSREIEWKHITPFAPWQGGVYERLIKSVKYSLYKTLKRSTPTFEEMTTVLIEIEALLNTRPLVYVSSDSCDDTVIRPIDFLQNKITLSYPMDTAEQTNDDPSYFPAQEQAVLRTKQQTIEALESSCKATERFWIIWRTQYLTSLREKHKLHVGHSKSTSLPQEGDCVLITDPIQPRHSWRMGRITELVAGADGETREAVVILPSRRQIRRPVNLLVPLELEDRTEKTKDSVQENQDEELREEPAPPRYDLRPRKRIDYNEERRAPFLLRISPLLTLVASLLCLCVPTTAHPTNWIITNSLRNIQCFAGGVEIRSKDQTPYEVCADNFCRYFELPRALETVHFPPQVLVHEQNVHWKMKRNNSIQIIELTCPPSSFCEHVTCFLCTDILFNPECWPVGAIISIALILYFLLTGCYVFFYMPVVIGKPVRILLRLGFNTVTKTLCCLFKRGRKERSRRRLRRDLIELLAIACLVSAITLTHGCQYVNIFSHKSSVCTQSDNGQVCHLRLSEILKVNPFKREACFRLTRNRTTIHEIRVYWEALELTCEPETDTFTRDTMYRIVDSKRCPHTGSCTGEKCALINSTSIIPELAKGNEFPGRTACVESCGGPGCDCFYWSSGCLFYRIYATPTSPQIYEVFHCNRWREAAIIKLSHFDAVLRKSGTFTGLLHMQPNVPIMWKFFTFTLSSITLPPTPLLNRPFISDGNTTALWDYRFRLPLRCANRTAAKKLQCQFEDHCTCFPAESQANCKCSNVSLSSWFNNINHVLPAVFSSVSFKLGQEGEVQASIANMVTAEIIMTAHGNFSTDVIVEDAVCKIENADLQGCYKCAKGATAEVTCSSTREVQAEVICDGASFTIGCSRNGTKSVLRFSFNSARIHMKCSVSCGSIPTDFELGGVLKFTQTGQSILTQWIEGGTSSISETEWPDFSHIIDVVAQWYKTALLVAAILLILLALTYVILSACGLRCFLWIIKQLLRLFRTVLLAPFRCICVCVHVAKESHNKTH